MTMMKKTTCSTYEKIPIAIIYKEDGKINIEYTDENRAFEIYGFLQIILIDMEQNLLDSLERQE